MDSTVIWQLVETMSVLTRPNKIVYSQTTEVTRSLFTEQTDKLKINVVRMLWSLRSGLVFVFNNIPTSLCITFWLCFQLKYFNHHRSYHLVQCVIIIGVNLSPFYLGKCLSGNLIALVNMKLFFFPCCLPTVSVGCILWWLAEKVIK